MLTPGIREGWHGHAYRVIHFKNLDSKTGLLRFWSGLLSKKYPSVARTARQR